MWDRVRATLDSMCRAIAGTDEQMVKEQLEAGLREAVSAASDEDTWETPAARILAKVKTGTTVVTVNADGTIDIDDGPVAGKRTRAGARTTANVVVHVRAQGATVNTQGDVYVSGNAVSVIGTNVYVRGNAVTASGERCAVAGQVHNNLHTLGYAHTGNVEGLVFPEGVHFGPRPARAVQLRAPAAHRTVDEMV